MTGVQRQRQRRVSALLLAAAAIVLGLSIAAAREVRWPMRGTAQSSLLFPGFTADERPRPARGLVVTSLQSASEAQMNGIAVGDEVLAIDRRPVRSLDEAARVMNQDRRAMLALRLLHNNIPRDVTLHDVGARQHGA